MPRSEHSNISIFIPHIGCPHRCSFCDQRTISGEQDLPDGEYVKEVCEKALGEVKSPENTEIAFFGGSFTAIPVDYMTELLEAAHGYLGEGKFAGIRCSTRPDCIDDRILRKLKGYGVTAIELGAQSMDDEVLRLNERGHTAQDVVNACGLIRGYGFELGLQMMTGLYGSSPEKDMYTAERIVSLRPDTVRIYPTVVLRGTALAVLYSAGKYPMMPLEEMAELCGKLMELFHREDIAVIKCGLHASESVEKDMVAGYYHPAFREMCEMYVYRRMIEQSLEHSSHKSGAVTVEVNDRCISRAVGQKKANIEFFRSKGFDISIKGNSDIPMYECRIIQN